MPSLRHHEPGDLYVKLSVKFPEHIDPALIHYLEQALPPRKPMDEIPRDAIVEEVVLAEPENRRQPDFNGDDSMDEDHDEPRVQCGNQ